jgi:hypothetical protein
MTMPAVRFATGQRVRHRAGQGPRRDRFGHIHASSPHLGRYAVKFPHGIEWLHESELTHLPSDRPLSSIPEEGPNADLVRSSRPAQGRLDYR